jgi:hypothetical protein
MLVLGPETFESRLRFDQVFEVGVPRRPRVGLESSYLCFANTNIPAELNCMNKLVGASKPLRFLNFSDEGVSRFNQVGHSLVRDRHLERPLRER